jgi:hypothetical protein
MRTVWDSYSVFGSGLALAQGTMVPEDDTTDITIGANCSSVVDLDAHQFRRLVTEHGTVENQFQTLIDDPDEWDDDDDDDYDGDLDDDFNDDDSDEFDEEDD